jgi:hypothetical protein
VTVLAALVVTSALAAPPKPKTAVYRGEVVRFSSISITVHTQAEPLRLRTFTYSAKLREQVIKMLETGGYQYGDKVKIRYLVGEDVAISIRGKASQHRRHSGKQK